MLFIDITQASPPAHFSDLLQKVSEKYHSLSVNVHSNESMHQAVIHGKLTTRVPTGNPIYNPRMIVDAPHDSSDMLFKFEANLMTISSGCVSDDRFDDLLQSLLDGSDFRVCPGVPHSIMEKCTFEIKSARKWTPFLRMDHERCEQWFKVSHKRKRFSSTACIQCTKLRRYVVNEIRRRAAVTATQLAKRALPSSKCNIKYLTPCTKRMRLALMKKGEKGHVGQVALSQEV